MNTELETPFLTIHN